MSFSVFERVWLRIGRSQVRVLPSALQKVLFCRYFCLVRWADRLTFTTCLPLIVFVAARVTHSGAAYHPGLGRSDRRADGGTWGHRRVAAAGLRRGATGQARIGLVVRLFRACWWPASPLVPLRSAHLEFGR